MVAPQVQGEGPPLPYTLTPTVSATEEEPSWGDEPVQAKENEILKEAVIYAIRVKKWEGKEGGSSCNISTRKRSLY